MYKFKTQISSINDCNTWLYMMCLTVWKFVFWPPFPHPSLTPPIYFYFHQWLWHTDCLEVSLYSPPTIPPPPPKKKPSKNIFVTFFLCREGQGTCMHVCLQQRHSGINRLSTQWHRHQTNINETTSPFI